MRNELFVKTVYVFAFCFVVNIMTGRLIFAETHNNEEHGHDEAQSGKFEASKFIFDHIGDAHDWHVMTIKDKHISIPLPVILYSQTQGLQVFMSTKFHHGHESYKNFHLKHEGSGKGTIVEIHEDGTETYPLDLSITKNIAALFCSVILLLWVFISMANRYKKHVNKPPKGVQSVFEPIIIFLRDEIAKPSIGHNYEKFMPYLLTVFFFIWFNNMLGLIPIPPGGANLTGNIAVTMVLALFTFIITTIHGNKNYWKHIFNTPGVPWWMKFPIPLMPIIEIFGMFTKPFVLMIRLFANISAGHIIALGFLSLVFIFGEINVYVGHGVSVFTIIFLIFMTFLELLVAFIQAYVFTFLSALYFGFAVEEHH